MTLIEVLVVIWILSFGYLALLSYQIQAQRELGALVQRQKALDLAHTQINEMSILLTQDDFEQLTSGRLTHTPGHYQLDWRVTSHSLNEKLLTVQVSWQDLDGPQQLELSALVARTSAVDSAQLEF